MANQDEVHETREASGKGKGGPEREPMIYGKRKGKTPSVAALDRGQAKKWGSVTALDCEHPRIPIGTLIDPIPTQNDL